MLAFHRLAFIVPMAITNSNILKIAATRLQSQDADWQEWAAYVLRAIGQQASGMKPDFMSPISRHDLMREDAELNSEVLTAKYAKRGIRVFSLVWFAV
jgi:hypothetical protein